MLHLHCLVWFTGNIDFFDLRGKMLNHPEFSWQMVGYIDSVIAEHIDPCKNDGRPSEVLIPSMKMMKNMWIHCTIMEMPSHPNGKSIPKAITQLVLNTTKGNTRM